MAKKYTVVVQETLEKMYADNGSKTPISTNAIAAWGKALGQKADLLFTNGKGKWELNRIKRLKGTVPTDTSAGAGDRIVKRLNKARKKDWVTIETAIGTKEDFLLEIQPEDAANFSANPADFKSGIEQEGSLLAIEAEERAIEAIIGSNNVAKVSIGDVSTDLEAFGEKLYDKMAVAETDIMQLVDDFIHMSDTAMYVSPIAAKALAAYKGTAFNVDKSSYADSIVPNFSFDNSSEGYTNPHFDKFVVDMSANGGTATDKVIAIIMKKDAYFYTGILGRMIPLDTKLLDEEFKGHSFWTADALVDPDRIIVITGKVPTKAVKKVSA